MNYYIIPAKIEDQVFYKCRKVSLIIEKIILFYLIL